jgi:protein Mpv17
VRKEFVKKMVRRFTLWRSPFALAMIAALVLSWSNVGIMSFSFSSPPAPRRSDRLFGADLQRKRAQRIVAAPRGDSPTQLHSVMVSAVAALDTFWKTQPYLAAGLTCGLKASAADIVAQKRHFKLREEVEQANDEEEESIETPIQKTDYQRNLAYLLYGVIYQGVAQEFVYNHLYPVWFGTGTSVGVVATKVLFDLLVQTTLVTLPIAYLTKAIIYRYSFGEAVRRYIDDIQNHGLLKKYVLLWGPVQCLTFSIVPEHLRVTFIAFVSFFWLIILSTIASRTAVVVDNQECSLQDGLTCNIDG